VNRPDHGKVIDADISADVSEESIKYACDVLESEGTIPRVLMVCLDEDLDLARDLSHKNGLTWVINSAYSTSEWSVHNLKEGEERITYWSPPF
jgi:hypothetical protein